MSSSPPATVPLLPANGSREAPPPRSDALVFFGATGDLAYKKIFPALQSMIRRGHLNVPVIGVAKAGWKLEQFRDHAKASLAEHGGGVNEAAFSRLVELLRYVDGDYNDSATFEELRRQLGGSQRPIHYLAIPQSLFATVIQQLDRSGCAHDARVVLEKPFGRDLESAKKLNAILRQVFDEASIFRIDHYLGKEAVQNLIVLRFANTFLEPIWNRHYVESVQVTMAEQFGVQGRGSFYEQTGAIRDVVQNHMLQVIGCLAMEPPATTYHEAVRDELVKVFRQIEPLDPSGLVRGQFRGYKAEPGVAPNSRVETFAAVRLEIDSWRWDGVPFFIPAGKCLPLTATEVMVKLKRPPVTKMALGEGNYLRFQLSPEVRIALGMRIKKPGEAMTSEPSELSFIHYPSSDEMDAYERLLGDAMAGDATLFARQDAVEAAWKVVEPILGDDTPLEEYAPGSWGPANAAALTADVGGWTPLLSEVGGHA
jgi:glucose-6-phosphate 1-dehydrogenase